MIRARWLLAATLGLMCLLRCSCEPALIVNVTLPEDFDREGLTVELSVFAPAADFEIDCDKIAYGDVHLPQLLATRTYLKVWTSLDGGPPEDSSSNNVPVEVPRSGQKIALALGAYDFEGGEIDEFEAVLAGCVEIGAVTEDTTVQLPTGPTARIVVDQPRELFLSAALLAEGSTEVLVQRRAPDGTLAVQPAGLTVSLEDFEGRPIESSVRFDVIAPLSEDGFTRTVGPGQELASTLQVDQPGPFWVEIRARFQRDFFDPLPGLAYRELLDSDEDPVLASAIDRADWVRPAQVSSPGGGLWSGFISSLPAMAGDGSEVVLTRLTEDLEAEQYPLLSTQEEASPPRLLGFVELGRPEAQRLAVLATRPLALPGNIALLPAPDSLAIEIPFGLEPVMSAVGMGACDQGDAALPLLVGLAPPPPVLGIIPEVTRYWRLDLIGQPPLLTLIEEYDDLAGQGPLLMPSPMTLPQSLCVDSVGPFGLSGRRRLLSSFNLRSGASFLGLNGDQAVNLTAIRDAGQFAGVERPIRIEGLVEESELLVHDEIDRRFALAAVWLNDALEVNLYGLESHAGSEELGFEGNRFRVPMPERPLAVRIATGHFTQSPSEGPEQLELALLVVTITETQGVPRVVGQLYFGPLVGFLPAGLMPLQLSLADCNRYDNPPEQGGRFCGHEFDSQLLAADVDGDGIDELLLVTREGDPIRWRARIMGFSP